MFRTSFLSGEADEEARAKMAAGMQMQQDGRWQVEYSIRCQSYYVNLLHGICRGCSSFCSLRAGSFESDSLSSHR